MLLVEQCELPVTFLYAEVTIDGRLLVKEAVCCQGSQHVHGKVEHASMPGVYSLRHILQLVVDGLNDRSLAQHDFVIDGHQFVLHVTSQARYQMDAIGIQTSEEGL